MEDGAELQGRWTAQRRQRGNTAETREGEREEREGRRGEQTNNKQKTKPKRTAYANPLLKSKQLTQQQRTRKNETS